MTDLEKIDALLSYDPETGVLRWKVNRKSNHVAGKVAGHVGQHRRTKYISIKILSKQYLAHRIAWLITTGDWPMGQIDHINGDGLDNRIANLRDVKGSESQRLNLKNTSGVNGVHFHKGSGMWVAAVAISKRKVHLGSFRTLEEAAEARQTANLKYGFSDRHGEPMGKASDDVSGAFVVQSGVEDQRDIQTQKQIPADMAAL